MRQYFTKMNNTDLNNVDYYSTDMTHKALSRYVARVDNSVDMKHSVIT